MSSDYRAVTESGLGIRIRPLAPDDLQKVIDLQARYLNRYPEAAVVQGSTYRAPGSSAVKDLFCAFDFQDNLVGYASLFPAIVTDGSPNLSHTLWADVKTAPEQSRQDQILGVLLDYLFGYAREVAREFSFRPTQIIFQNYPTEVAIIQFLQQQGFVHTESIYQLTRDLSQAIPEVLAPPGMQAVPWRMESEAEQRTYVQARNIVFPESSITLDDWRDFMNSALWNVGTCLAIFDGPDLAGSIALYWDEEQNQRTGRQVGFTEYIFVLPRWRGLGLGTYLVSQGLAYLRKHGLREAQLEVKAANVGALGLYTRLGYQVARESWFFEKTL
jgi:ribosomal protein S18 acetylase RimI-like enzyme